MGVHVCRPGQIALRRITNCPTCQARRRFSGVDAAYFGCIWTCCTCGDSWGEGELMPRPFRRGWRSEAAAKARLVWRAGVRVGSPAHCEFIRVELGQEAE